MKTKHFLMLLLLPLLAVNCKKEETHKLVTVGGYAVDVATGDTLADVKIRLRRMDTRRAGTGDQLRGFGITPLDSTTTDANGFFTFTLLMDVNKPYGFEPIKDNYYWNPYMTLTTLHVGSGINKIVQLIPLTYLKVNIVNENPMSSNDSIYYSGPSDRSSIYVDNWHLPSTYKHKFGLKGSQLDTSFYVTLTYEEVPLQYWDVTKNGTTIRNAAYIGCNPLDTCFFQIKY